MKTNIQTSTYSQWKHLLVVLLLGLMSTSVTGASYYNKYYDDAVSSGSNTDDDFIDLSSIDLDQVSLMPVSCVNYNNGNMIKFQLFSSSNNFQCHNNNLGTFVVSISHYMRAYFNYQALIRGSDFKLPSDAGYLNCVLLQQTAYTDTKLYAKIGCLERDTYTSTKLAVHVYTDKQCSEPYDDGQSGETRASRGYNINGYRFSPKVSFRPPFYSCLSCKPSEIASSFSRKKTFWYDDDAAASGQQIQKFFDDWLDDYFLNDDKYFEVQKYVGNEKVYSKEDDDDFYTIDDDRRLEEVEQDKIEMQQKQQHGARNLIGKTLELQAAEGELEVCKKLLLFLLLLTYKYYFCHYVVFSSVYSYIINCSHLNVSFGQNKRKFVSLANTTKATLVTMIPKFNPGIYARNYTSMVFGATNTADLLIPSASINGQLQMSSSYSSCYHSCFR